jgi:uncharacterized protein (TIGR03435 family)
MRLGVSLRVSFAALMLGVASVSPIVLRADAMQAAATATTKPAIADVWQGTLHADKDLRTIVKITQGPNGALKGQWYSIDQTPRPIPIKTTTFQDGALRLDIEDIDGVYTGKISADGNLITGEWKQAGKTFPLILARATNETAWTIPEPPKAVPPMATDADPNWEVATIKPASPDEKGKGFGGPPRQFKTINTTLNDLIAFAYDLNPQQIVGGPEWMGADKYDIATGEPDVPGAPSQKQLKSMLRKLMEQRFGLKSHQGKKDMAAYVLTVAKGGPKMTKNETGEHRGSSFYFTKLGSLVFRDNTMDDFCHGMQGAVFDRPVVNHTGLDGHWDSALKWTPDESQFQVFGVKIVPDESPEAPPSVFIAIQQQIGLKLDAEKTAVDVMVLDHVEKPSDN